MIIGLRESRAHDRWRRIWRVVKWLFVLAVISVFGIFMYQTGATVARTEAETLSNEVRSLTATVTDLRQTAAQARAGAEQALAREAHWRSLYAQEVPTGPAKELLGLLQQSLQAGVPPKKLATLINSASKERSCERQPQAKRFMVRTPIGGGSDPVAFADGAIMVAADGEPSTDAAGNRQAWFDPAKPVTLHFMLLGGGKMEAAGVLPLEHSVVRGDSEHRFTVAVAERRGFVTVTTERCKFP
jgi:hypothetical protein